MIFRSVVQDRDYAKPFVWAWLAAVALLSSGCASDRHPARVFTIGTDNTYPYHFLDSAGKPGGMVGEVIQVAATRAGIQLEWRVAPEGPHAALNAGTVELWPLVSNQRELWPQLHFSEPYLSNSFIEVAVDQRFTLVKDPAPVKRIATASFPLVMKLAGQAFPNASVIRHRTREQALTSVCTGAADAALMEARALQHIALQRPPGCEAKLLYTNGLNVPPSQLAVASTLQAAWAADRLRREIDFMMKDGSMTRILSHWNYFYGGEAAILYNEKKTRSANQRSLWFAGALGILSALLLVLLAIVRRAQRAAVAADAAKSMFLANMSHEIRTPMNGVIGMVQLALHLAKDIEQRDYLVTAQDSANSLLSLLNDILDLSRIEAGKMTIDDVVADPRRVVREVVHVLELSANAKGLRIHVHCADMVPSLILCDALRLRQILVNLLGNSIKFTEKGRVDINLELEGQRALRFTVKDTGIGIPLEQQASVFETFTQADGSISRKYGGSGLGLAISSKLVQLMGGILRMESRPGDGTTFEFVVPFRLPSSTDTPEGPPRLDSEPLSAKRILVAEDNRVNQQVAQRLLEQAGHRVTVVSNGREALAAIAQEAFDVVLMDVQMPEMDGLETTARIRAREAATGHHTPILAMTAHAMAGDRERCLAMGMDGYVSKPVQLTSLLSAIREVTERTPKHPDIPAISS